MKPLNNTCLIEIIRDNDGVSRFDEGESKNKGKLVSVSVNLYHLTASSAIRFDDDFLTEMYALLTSMNGKIVRWEEYAEQGQIFEEDGKQYALIPWWRLIGVEDDK